jgi:hypothetical protein
MSEKTIDTDFNRRGFLKAAVVTAAAATATGSAAGLLIKEKGQAPVSLPKPVQIEPLPGVSGTSLEMTELRSQLAAAQAENSRLQIRLSTAQSQLDLMRKTDSAQDNVALEAWRLQLDEANVQVASLSDEVTILRGLVNLYEQLDAVDMATVVGGGLAAVGGVLGEIADDMPSVTEGIQAGQEALSEFEGQLPYLKEGRQWLSGRIELLSQSYQTIEQAVQKAVKTAGTFLQQLNEWVQDILKWLPFGIGDKAAKILDAIAHLLTEIPDTLEGLIQRIAQPLDLWLEEEGEEMRIQRRLVKPVREKALIRATQTINHVETLQNVYRAQLADPVEVASESHQAIKSRIDEYRRSYNL